jgi:hypothetical protein
MSLHFERGNPRAPVGHALLYWRGNDGTVVASYVSVPPIKFDVGKFMPPFLAQMTQDIDLSSALMAPPMPPIPEQVPGHDYLTALAAHRSDDLIFVGPIYDENPMKLTADLQEAASQYAEMYESATQHLPAALPVQSADDTSQFADLSEQEQLAELTRLTGRYLDSMASGTPDTDVEEQMRQLAALLPPKYRLEEMMEAVHEPGQRGRRLAELYIERSYKLFNEDYLELERIDREIEAAHHA